MVFESLDVRFAIQFGQLIHHGHDFAGFVRRGIFRNIGPEHNSFLGHWLFFTPVETTGAAAHALNERWPRARFGEENLGRQIHARFHYLSGDNESGVVSQTLDLLLALSGAEARV